MKVHCEPVRFMKLGAVNSSFKDFDQLETFHVHVLKNKCKTMVMGEAKKDFTALLSGGGGHNVCPLWSYFSRRSTFFCPIHFMALKQKLTLVSSPTYLYLLFSFPYIHFLIYDCWTFFDAARTHTLEVF